jgi:hypothetical protein
MPIGSVSAVDAQKVTDRAWQIQNQISEIIRNLTLAKAEELLKIVQNFNDELHP